MAAKKSSKRRSSRSRSKAKAKSRATKSNCQGGRCKESYSIKRCRAPKGSGWVTRTMQTGEVAEYKRGSGQFVPCGRQKPRSLRVSRCMRRTRRGWYSGSCS